MSVTGRVGVTRQALFFFKALISLSAALSLLIAPSDVWAQAGATVPLVGILSFARAPSETDPDPEKGVLQGLRDLGYVEGRNIHIERRYADGQPDRLAAQAAELVQLKVDVILAGGPGPREAASKATSSIPIVTISGSDPVQEGWAQSLAHPGGNITGMTVTFPELDLKRLEILKQAFPEIRRVAVFTEFDPDNANKQFKERMEAAARQLGFQLQYLEARGPDDFDAVFSLARRGHAQALTVIATNLAVSHRTRLAALAAADSLPSISEFPLMAQAGFLLAYGADLDDLGRRSIEQIDKILKGAHAGDLPIERPMKFRLVVNLRTAKKLGLTVSQSLLLRADEVIK